MIPFKLMVKCPYAFGTVVSASFVLVGLVGPQWVKRDVVNYEHQVQSESHERYVKGCHLELAVLQQSCTSREQIRSSFDAFGAILTAKEYETRKALTDRKQRSANRVNAFLSKFLIVGSVCLPAFFFLWLRGQRLDEQLRKVKIAKALKAKGGTFSPVRRSRRPRPKRPM